MNQATRTQDTRQPTPKGPGSVSGAPHLPRGFTRTFTSRYINAGEVRLHAVIGGDGPPLLLIHGWPETWYAWRMVMPALARDFTVIAPDQRGIGLSDKPATGYDTGTLANDMVALMEALGHQQFALYGTDTGMPIAYALAADHPERVARLALSEAFIPGVGTSPPLLLYNPMLNARLWHLTFNQLPAEVNDALVRGREAIFFGAEFDASAGTNKLPAETVRYYVDRLTSDRDALRGSFGFYRAIIASAEQNKEHMKQKLTLPVLAIGGTESTGAIIPPATAPSIENTVRLVADNVQSAVVPHGHWVAEQAPEELLAALTTFLAPYRDGVAALAR